MTTFAHRSAALTAAALIGLTMTFAGSGVALADPYDDGDGTVDVQPDYGGAEPDYGPEPADVPDEPPADVGAEPDEPGPPVDEGAEPDEPGPPVDAEADAPGPPADEPGAGDTDLGGPGAGPDPDGAADPGAGAGDDGVADPGAGADDQPATEGESAATDADVIDADVAQADSVDVTTAQTAGAVASTDEVATESTIDEMRTTIESEYLSSDSTVTQWDSSWVQYDQYYQPVLVNPYRSPVRFAYSYAGKPHVVKVPPLGRAVVNVPRPGIYAFTALVPNSSGGVSNVSVGSFSGGGYAPRPDHSPPPKPASPNTYRNVVVRFDFGDRKFAPVTIKSVTDLGVDPQVGANKVLLDDETPAWGSWDTTASGQRELTVKLTEALPGLTEPVAEPPPSYTLVAAQQNPSGSGISLLGWIGLGLGGLAVVAVFLFFVIHRGRHTAT